MSADHQVVATGCSTRYHAVRELFESLDALLVVYRSMPEDGRTRRWNADAERVTGEVARLLCTARSQISGTVPR